MKTEELSLLLSINEAMAKVKDTEDLFQLVFNKLRVVYPFKLAGVEILNKNKTHLELILKSAHLPMDFNTPFEFYEKVPIDRAPIKISFTNPKIERIKVSDDLGNPKYGKTEILKNAAKKYNLDEIIHAPLQTGGEVKGIMILAFASEDRLKDDDFVFLQHFTNQLAVLMTSQIAYHEIVQREQIKEFQLELTNSLFVVKDRAELFLKTFAEINKLISLSYACIHLESYEMNEAITISFVKDREGNLKEQHLKPGYDIPFLTLKSRINSDEEVVSFEFVKNDFEKLCQQSSHFRNLRDNYGVTSVLYVNFTKYDKGEMSFLFSKEGSGGKLFAGPLVKGKYFAEPEIDFVLKLLPQMELILFNFFAYEEINRLRKQLEQEKDYLLDEINLANNFQEIIGNSFLIQNVLTKVRQIAPLHVNVLIQGETGTGKELIARAIHNLSDRSERTLVKVNCASLPANLIESELFGHEKGSFTGAVERRIGKFELANGGTIFLDEIGELPLELQAKLLRVLQEQEIERLGGKEIIKIDVRIISATNRNLEKEVELGNFRADLFFRLNVFPIELPPLRKRTEDIPLFVKFFIEKYSKKVGKPVKSIKKTDIEMLQQYEWPGNIRELEHLIERSVIISSGQNLEFADFVSVKTLSKKEEKIQFKPLAEIEREYIIAALKSVNGKITGENGAAKLLGINGKTLGSKLKKLNIKKEVIIS